MLGDHAALTAMSTVTADVLAAEDVINALTAGSLARQRHRQRTTRRTYDLLSPEVCPVRMHNACAHLHGLSTDNVVVLVDRLKISNGIARLNRHEPSRGDP